MLFCPYCANILLIETTATGSHFFCPTCPYTFNVQQKMTKKLYLEKKKVDEVIGRQQWQNIDSTVRCPRCGRQKAYFYELQIRSADEPATQFFKCAHSDCGFQWREN
jgi:DNA-directed RNA polymerase III subunit RPC11